jgi:hypothetical protein
MRLRYLAALAGVMLAPVAAADLPREPAEITHWLEAIRQPPEMTRWQRIPWVTSLPEGFRLARQEKRPLLVWGSDDDPLDRC